MTIRIKSFLVWLAVVPVLSALCVIGVNLLPLWFVYLLPYAIGVALLAILVAIVAAGGATKTLGASFGGLAAGVVLVFVAYDIVKTADRADWNASYDEFRQFSQVVARGDRKATALALDDLRRFTPAEALCILGTDSGTGGSGYLMPDGPDTQRTRQGNHYFISPPRLFEVAEILVSTQPAKRETQVALYKMLQDLHWRDDPAAFPRWEQLWLRTKAATGGTAGWHFDGARLRRPPEQCGGDDDTHLAWLIDEINKPPETPKKARAHESGSSQARQAADNALRDAQNNAIAR
ncbi:hypothetical protein [Variovorax sp. 38R]|uniref:hypothetical protein n=1 Tax=Variovorax sp. 38R TaxID=2774875 RepID=UPI001780CB5C|nr:hypothetical protein [Variovorax sp. 38R]QOF76781.1 hypothetical protein IG196_20755 [Variovorax sp. 38R]